MSSQFSLWRRKSIWLLLAAAICIVLTGASLTGAGLTGPGSVVVVTIALVVFVYGMDSLIDEMHPLKALLCPQGLVLWPFLAVGLWLAHQHSTLSFLSALIILLLGLSYNYPVQLPARVFRLKTITGVKGLWIGAGWALLVYLGAGTLDLPHVQVVASFVALQVMVGSTLRDLHDVEEDRASGTHTLPLVLGVKKTYTLLHFINVLSGVLIFVYPLPWSSYWLVVLLWRAATLEWLRLGNPGHYATQYMNLATCGVILLMRMVHYAMD